MWHIFWTPTPHIYILGFYLASQHFMWHGFCTSITHIYSGILSGITTFYVAWVLYFHYTHIYIYIYVLAFYLASQHLMWHGFCTSITHIYSGILSGITRHFMWHGFCTSITHIFSGILSGITTFYLACIQDLCPIHIFWHSICMMVYTWTVIKRKNLLYYI